MLERPFSKSTEEDWHQAYFTTYAKMNSFKHQSHRVIDRISHFGLLSQFCCADKKVDESNKKGAIFDGLL